MPDQYPLTITEALQRGAHQLGSHSDSPRLDSEILLLKVLNNQSGQHYTKSWLLAWPERTLNAEQMQRFNQYLDLRSKGMPIAYITGEQGFWTFTVEVTPATLIPRPESELLVENALEKIAPAEHWHILDLGTGSGAIALAIASERRNSTVLACDSCPKALAVAQKNARRLKLPNVRFCQSHWFANIPQQPFDVIVSNPPYIATNDSELEDNVRKYEPLSALHAGDDGLDDIRRIIRQSPDYLKSGGWLLLEHGYTQAQAVQSLLQDNHFKRIATINDLNHLPRVTQAQR